MQTIICFPRLWLHSFDDGINYQGINASNLSTRREKGGNYERCFIRKQVIA